MKDATCRKCHRRYDKERLEGYRDGGGNQRYRCAPSCEVNALIDLKADQETPIEELLTQVDETAAEEVIIEESVEEEFSIDDLFEDVSNRVRAKGETALKTKYRKALEQINEYERVLQLVGQTKNHKPRTLKTKVTSKNKSHTCAAILHLSDIHVGSIISGSYVNGRGYNPKMSAEFLATIAETVKVFIAERETSLPVDELIVNLGGDLVEVLDHGQQQLEVTEQVLLAQDLIYNVFKSLLTLGIPIRSYVVSGNHDRLTKYHRVPTTNRTIRSFDWIIANNLMRLLPDVDFIINESYVVEFDVKGYKFIMHHGDAIKGGAGIAGFFPSMAKWHYRRQQMNPFDYALVGHFHQSCFLQSKIIVNGGLPGASGYTDNLAIDASKRCQNLIFVDSRYGVNAINQISV